MGKTASRISFFYDISRLVIAANANGIDLLPHCFHRLQTQQDTLYKDGKSKTEHSKHQDWLAIDFVVIKDGKAIWDINKDYEWLSNLWKKMGHKWGGDFLIRDEYGELVPFRDGCHFEE